MRIIMLLLISFLVVRTALPQQPSQKEIQVQMRVAKAEANKQIAEMEKQIAEAKLIEENPETIEEMEQQLAMLKKMLGVIDDVGSQKDPKALRATKIVKPKYVSPFVPITLKQPANAPTKEQAKDQLFGYLGKKIDANTLITTEGVIVQYDKVNNRLIVQPDKRVDTLYYGLVNTLARTAQMQNDFVVRMEGIENSFFMFPEILKAYKEFDHFRDMNYNTARNTIDLPLVPIEYLDPDLERTHNLLVAMRDRLAEMTRTLPLSGITAENLLPAPERPHNLCLCDTIPVIAFRDRLRLWVSEFYEDEGRLWDMIMDMSRKMQTFLAQGGRSIPNWNATIFAAKSLKLQRESKKLLTLIVKYEREENIYKEDALAKAATQLMANLSIQYKAMLPDDESYKRQAELLVIRAKNIVFKKFFKEYIEDQKSRRNYNVVFDYSLYTSHEYNKKLFDPNYNIPVNLVNTWIGWSNKFNRFTLMLTMDFEMLFVDKEEKEIMIADGFLKSDPLIVSLGRFDCKWQLYKKEVNHRDRNASDETFHIPIKVVQGKKDFLDDGKPPFYYRKPAYMQMVFPSVRISFCKDANGGEIKDSAYLDVLRYGDNDIKSHQNDDYSQKYSTDMIMYANKMFLGIKKTELNTGELIDVAGKMMNIEGITQRPPSTGHPLLDQLMMEFTMNQQKHKLQDELSETTHTGKTVIPFDAINTTSHVLIQHTHDTKDARDQDKEIGINMVRGLIILRVHHDPLP